MPRPIESKRRSRRSTSGNAEDASEIAVEGPLDIKEPEDDEYEEEDVEEDEEEPEEEPDEDEEEEDAPPRSSKKRRARPSKKRTTSYVNEDDQEDVKMEEEEDDDEDEEVEAESNKRQQVAPVAPHLPKRRGRKPAVAPEGTLRSDSGRVLKVVDDEYDVSEDEEGETKVDANGNLSGGRQYRVRTFTVKGKGDKLYMLSTEPARCMGFRDSYLLFQKYRTLYKVVVDNDEKFDLIDRDIIPHSYKGRTIGLVTARSVFREFGAKIVVGGRHITDDYYVKKLKKSGKVKEGELAEPTDVVPPAGTPYNRNQFVAWHGASSVYHPGVPGPASTPSYEPAQKKAMRATISEDNWMLQHAHAIREVDTILLQNRMVLARGMRDPYTGTIFVPARTQPTHVEYVKLVDSDKKLGKRQKLVYETKMNMPNLAMKTCLKDVPLDVFADCVDEDVKKAILQQQEYEKTLV